MEFWPPIPLSPIPARFAHEVLAIKCTRYRDLNLLILVLFFILKNRLVLFTSETRKRGDDNQVDRKYCLELIIIIL